VNGGEFRRQQEMRVIPYGVAFVVVSLICGFVYSEVQQDFRQSANDPQIQMAEDAAALIARGTQPNFGADPVEISESLAPYMMIFDSNGNLTQSTATLDGHAPKLPNGVLDWARRNGEDRISWQPRPGVRSALVVVPVKGGAGGFVAVGRSMREVEKRIAFAMQGAVAAWVILLATSFAGIFVVRRNAIRQKS
jgi:hypothetical protein